jgi:hypothetical protein
MAYRPLSGEELSFFLSRTEPNELKLAKTITHLDDENARLADENARLRSDQRRLHAYILEKENAAGSGKSDLEWINNARLAAAHLALTTGGCSYVDAATALIKWRPAITKLLKENSKTERPGTIAFTDKDRIVQVRKNFHSGRATKNEAARLAYRYARKKINRCKNNPDALEELARSLIWAIDL